MSPSRAEEFQLGTRVHGYEEKTKFHVIDLKKKQNFMYPGTWIWEKIGANFFLNLTHCFDIQFKNTLNLIFLGFKVPSERFFHKDFKTGLTFWNMWFKKI